MDGIEDWTKLEQDIKKAPGKAANYLGKALEVTARSIKDDWREGAVVDRTYAEDYANSISYDKKYSNTVLEVEVGPVIGKRASAGFLEEAPGDVLAPPLHAGRDAVRANEADFYEGIAIALYDATREAVEGT
ncbi:hypothetical protein [Microbacterium jejuense]|uniref:hypothetical protein n=1 Tax=Microbacterium jejuense TaxID=1263637 RepID=UPI0031E71F11